MCILSVLVSVLAVKRKQCANRDYTGKERDFLIKNTCYIKIMCTKHAMLFTVNSVQLATMLHAMLYLLVDISARTINLKMTKLIRQCVDLRMCRFESLYHKIEAPENVHLEF